MGLFLWHCNSTQKFNQSSVMHETEYRAGPCSVTSYMYMTSSLLSCVCTPTCTYTLYTRMHAHTHVCTHTHTHTHTRTHKHKHTYTHIYQYWEYSYQYRTDRCTTIQIGHGHSDHLEHSSWESWGTPHRDNICKVCGQKGKQHITNIKNDIIHNI